MAAPMSENVVDEKPQEKGRICEVEATVVTGFEQIARNDVRKRLGVQVETARGKIIIFIPFEDLPKLKDLQGVDNLYIVLTHFKEFQFADDFEEVKEQITSIIPQIDWSHGLEVWAKFFDFHCPVSPLPQPKWFEQQTEEGQSKSENDSAKTEQDTKEIDKTANKNEHDNSETKESAKTETQSASEMEVDKGDGVKSKNEQDTKSDSQISQSDITHGSGDAKSGTAESEAPALKKKKIMNPDMPAFRATCYRTGQNHKFQSPEAACHFGGVVQDYFGWNVDLKNFNIEVLLNIENDHMYVSIALTHQSKHKRHIQHFGPTTLRPTIAYNMLTMLNIKPGDVVCDPMVGGGSIPIEAALNWPEAYHICGDIHDMACPRTYMNIQALNEKRRNKGRRPIDVDVFMWDCTQLPLKDGSVDAIITDMPFGKRSGNRMSNWHLYPRTLREMARVCKPETGRAALLTQDKKCFLKIFHEVAPLWRRGLTLAVNIGGLAAGVFILHRTSQPVK